MLFSFCFQLQQIHLFSLPRFLEGFRGFYVSIPIHFDDVTIQLLFHISCVSCSVIRCRSLQSSHITVKSSLSHVAVWALRDHHLPRSRASRELPRFFSFLPNRWIFAVCSAAYSSIDSLVSPSHVIRPWGLRFLFSRFLMFPNQLLSKCVLIQLLNPVWRQSSLQSDTELGFPDSGLAFIYFCLG
jgi:hypothetical protein